MKTFREYLIESQRSYQYRIKIAGELDSKWIDLLIYNLGKFDPAKPCTYKTTPPQTKLADFPGLTNQPMTIISAEFRYPVTLDMIKQLVRLQGYDENLVLLMTDSYDDSRSKELEFENSTTELAATVKDTLDKNEVASMPEGEYLKAEAKKAGDEYADQYVTSILDNAASKRIKQPFAAGTPKIADRKLPDGNKQSPISNVRLPDRPKTGRSK